MNTLRADLRYTKTMETCCLAVGDLRSLDYLVYPMEGEEVTLLFSASPYIEERDLIADSFVIQQKKNFISGGWDLKQNRD